MNETLTLPSYRGHRRRIFLISIRATYEMYYTIKKWRLLCAWK